METAEWSVEDESREGSVVVVSNTDIDPRTVVVHLHNTPGVRGKKEGGRVRVFLPQQIEQQEVKTYIVRSALHINSHSKLQILN